MQSKNKNMKVKDKINEKFEKERFVEAFGLAKRFSAGHTRPNPPVGAVLVNNGEVIAAGTHERAGAVHAEVDTINYAKTAGKSTRGATLYVTLEPCSTAGKVGACTDAIVAAGIKEVVYGAEDPNPKNRGKAAKVLKKHGIVCRQTKNLAVRAICKYLIRGFAKHIKTGMPFVTVKLAMSLDGKFCDDHGDAKWITSASARKETSQFRKYVDVIMVGGETVRKDNPTLLPHGEKNDDLVRVVVTRSGKIPKNSKILTDNKNLTLVYKMSGKKGEKKSLKEVLKDLGKRGYCHVLCEGGVKLATALAEEGLVDEWIPVLAPKVIGKRKIGKAITINSITPLADSYNQVKELAFFGLIDQILPKCLLD